MSYEVAALPFQANANYGTWSLNFAAGKEIETVLNDKSYDFFFSWSN